VDEAGNDLLQALEEQRKDREQRFSTAAGAILDRAKGIVVQAKSPGDLDGLLADLQPLIDQQNPWLYSDPSAAVLVQKLQVVEQFVRSWQDYLSASASGHGDEARQALDRILQNEQLTSLGYFPRSEILERLNGPPLSPGPVSVSGAPEKSAMDRVNELLGQARTLDDVFTALNQISALPNRPIDLSDISTLQKQRVDVEAGLPVTLDLKAAVSGKSYGDDISRIESMELLDLLPYYLETRTSNPPEPAETVDTYLSRVATQADAASNLGLLQRALAVQKGLANAENPSSSPPFGADSLAQFLGGLSEEAAGHYAQAVTTYEKALGTYEPLLPVKIVGDRLGAIKAAHPDDYAKGLSDFETPAPVPRYQPGFPPGFLPGFRPGFPPGYPLPGVNELPIPLVVQIPAHDAATAPASAPK
jgi:tetratricopeptide (TPR) repeat protein